MICYSSARTFLHSIFHYSDYLPRSYYRVMNSYTCKYAHHSIVESCQQLNTSGFENTVLFLLWIQLTSHSIRRLFIECILNQRPLYLRLVFWVPVISNMVIYKTKFILTLCQTMVEGRILLLGADMTIQKSYQALNATQRIR